MRLPGHLHLTCSGRTKSVFLKFWLQAVQPYFTCVHLVLLGMAVLEALLNDWMQSAAEGRALLLIR